MMEEDSKSTGCVFQRCSIADLRTILKNMYQEKLKEHGCLVDNKMTTIE